MTVAPPDIRRHFIENFISVGFRASTVLKGANPAAYDPLKDIPGCYFCMHAIRDILRVEMKLMKNYNVKS